MTGIGIPVFVDQAGEAQELALTRACKRLDYMLEM